jgi:ankyrin repeat protein
MIRPIELKLELPMKLANDVMSTTTKVWTILSASRNGDLEKVKSLIAECPELAYAQYNYTPPIHFAVREGYAEMVTYLLSLGAYDPSYKIYPFQESLLVLAEDRGFDAITNQLNEYGRNPALRKFKGDNGEIVYNRTEAEIEFERAVEKEDLVKTKRILEEHPEFALNETFFWSEGILLFAAKECNYAMIDLLMSYGAKVTGLLKWTQFYYFERYDAAEYMMSKGMNPNTMSWQHVTLLHDMAQKGNIPKAELLIKHGASIDPIDEEYQSTPLGLAARWGQIEMVEYLLKQIADPNKSGAAWSTALAWARKKGHGEIEKILRSAGAKK